MCLLAHLQSPLSNVGRWPETFFWVKGDEFLYSVTLFSEYVHLYQMKCIERNTCKCTWSSGNILFNLHQSRHAICTVSLLWGPSECPQAALLILGSRSLLTPILVEATPYIWTGPIIVPYYAHCIFPLTRGRVWLCHFKLEKDIERG